MKITKLLMVMLLSCSLMFCTKGKTPSGSDIPGEDVPDDSIFDGLTPQFPTILGDDFTTSVMDNNNQSNVGDPKTLNWLADGKEAYYKGFTADATKAGLYFTKGNDLVWNAQDAQGDPYVKTIYFIGGKKQIINRGGDTTAISTDIKNTVLCSDKKQLRIFIFLDHNIIQGHQGTKPNIDTYVEAPPITLTGEPTTNC